ncbi:hypothetical protein GCM10009544_61240 [Streptomyces stramineus]|uniref:Uncharacterized protein n=1 Tax=Streptomyces stramineus TaxID=173861 RepID=A0ABN1B8L7_9ACTN
MGREGNGAYGSVAGGVRRESRRCAARGRTPGRRPGPGLVSLERQKGFPTGLAVRFREEYGGF